MRVGLIASPSKCTSNMETLLALVRILGGTGSVHNRKTEEDKNCIIMEWIGWLNIPAFIVNALIGPE